jgi:MFS family permease
MGIAFGLGGYLTGILCNHIRNDRVILLGLLGSTLGMALEGPLISDQHTSVMVAGMALVGFFASFVCVPVIPCLIQTMEKIYGSHNETIADKASALYNMSFAVGSIIAPLLGGGLADSIGYRNSTGVMVFTGLAVSAVYCFSLTIKS